MTSNVNWLQKWQIIRGKLRQKFAPPGSYLYRLYTSAIQWRHWLKHATSDEIAFQVFPTIVYKSIWVAYRKFKSKSVIHILEATDSLISMRKNIRHSIIFPPGLDWYTQLFQRPQQLALALARQGVLVFYFQPITSYNQEKIKLLEERLYLCSMPVESFIAIPNPIIYILTWNHKYIRMFDQPKIIYDFVDEIETFYGNHNRMRRDHQNLLKKANLVLTTAKRLHEQVLPFRKDALLCPNGVDYHHLSSARQPAIHIPADIHPILNRGKPIIGYYGALARWFDYPLLKELSTTRNDLSFLLIGPNYDNSVTSSGILNQKNVFWLGVKPYSEIPNYLHYFDVAMIPFEVNQITHSTSPLKLFEYMAGGKPVVISAMNESMRYPGVLVAYNVSEFSEKIDLALTLKNDNQYLSILDQVARQNTWNTRADQIITNLNALENSTDNKE